jgi:hypothetical protein
MKTNILILMLFIPLTLQAQDKPVILYPGKSFINQTSDTLFFLPKQKIETLMYREEIRKAIIQSLKARNAENDSLLCLKTHEANDWYSKLVETDKLLEESEVLKVQERHKANRKTKIWFGFGAVVGVMVGVVL